MSAAYELVLDSEHYRRITQGLIKDARFELWIATANVKSVLIEAPVGTRARARGAYVSITETFLDLQKRGVELRILHGGVPSGPFKRALAGAKLPMRHCPRQHMKLVIQDGAQAYLGSANLTGAGLGAKGDGRRNFEAGMVLHQGPAIETLQRQFDRVWRGQECASCKLRAQCPKPIDLLLKSKRPGKKTA